MLTVGAIRCDLPPAVMTTPAPAASSSRASSSKRAALALVGQTSTSAVRALPDWYPRNFDLAALARRLRKLLVRQGERERDLRPGGVRHLSFMDLDGTLVDSKMPVVLAHKQTGELLHYPDSGRLMILGVGSHRSYREDLAKLEARYDLPWDDYELNFDHGGNLRALLAEQPIRDQIARLRRQLRKATRRSFVITARSAAPAAFVAHEYLSRLGVDVHGVVAPNTRATAGVLGFEHLDLGENRTGRRKALTMAGLITLYGAHNIGTAEFHDDSDKNLRAAMQLLPALFPNIRFRFHDVVHERKGYERSMIAEAHGGVVRDPGGRPMSDAEIDEYSSTDAPWKPEPGAVIPERRGSSG